MVCFSSRCARNSDVVFGVQNYARKSQEFKLARSSAEFVAKWKHLEKNLHGIIYTDLSVSMMYLTFCLQNALDIFWKQHICCKKRKPNSVDLVKELIITYAVVVLAWVCVCPEQKHWHIWRAWPLDWIMSLNPAQIQIGARLTHVCTLGAQWVRDLIPLWAV